MTSRNTLRKTRQYTDAMLAWIRDSGKRVVVIIHDNPDPDCLASALALRQLFHTKLKREAVITFSGMIGRSENLALAKAMGIALTPLEIVNFEPADVVCMLDTQPGTGNNSLAPGMPVHILIDHHPLREASKQCPWVDVRQDYGVTATILFEYLQAQEVPIGPKLATALFYAIKSETQDLGREANRPDRDAYLALFPLSNKRLLYEITHPKLPAEYFCTITQALASSTIYGPILVSCLEAIAFPELVAEMADFLLRLEDVDTVLCMGEYNGEILLSIRTCRQTFNTGEAIKRLVAGLGMAGGHGMMAGGKIGGVEASGRTVAEVERTVTLRLLREFGLERVKGSRLVCQK
jgi:nanoRNase/pAp phosphatase (c-di-AMP/oligoRNAs hydrolase)